MAYNTRGYGMTAYMATGDPFLGGIFKGIGKVAKGAVGGFLGGGPIGAVIGGATSLLGGGRPMPVSRAAPPRGQFLGGRPIGITGQVALPPLGFPKISGGLQLGPPTTVMQAPVTGLVPGQKPAGYHLNKSDYFLRDGTFVPAGTKWVRNRRMNPANGRALRRSISRAKSFDNLVKRNRKNLRSLARI